MKLPMLTDYWYDRFVRRLERMPMPRNLELLPRIASVPCSRPLDSGFDVKIPRYFAQVLEVRGVEIGPVLKNAFREWDYFR